MSQPMTRVELALQVLDLHCDTRDIEALRKRAAEVLLEALSPDSSTNVAPGPVSPRSQQGH